MTVPTEDEAAELLVVSRVVGPHWFEPQERPTTVGGLLTLFDSVAEAGGGYLEIRFAGGDYPVLTIALRHQRAVLQRFAGPDQLDVMQGDGCLPPGGQFDVPVMGEDVSFDSELVITGALARAVLSEFAAGIPLDRVGTWNRL